MKKLGIVLSAVAVLAIVAAPSFALLVNEGTAVDLTVSANVPNGTQVNITATYVNAADDAFGAEVTELDFNTAGSLSYNATGNNGDGLYEANHYFAIDVGGVGAGDLTVVSDYTEGTTPSASQTEGLGNRATVDFQNMTDSNTGTSLQKIALIDVNNINTTVTAGWVRLYVGLAFDYSVTNTAPFTSADEPGAYNGTLTLTGTVN